jgi:hypothetical protein
MTRTIGSVSFYSPHEGNIMGRLAKVVQGQSQPGLKAFKKGGSVKHDDVAADKKLIAAELKKRGLKCGGKAKK